MWYGTWASSGTRKDSSIATSVWEPSFKTLNGQWQESKQDVLVSHKSAFIWQDHQIIFNCLAPVLLQILHPDAFKHGFLPQGTYLTRSWVKPGNFSLGILERKSEYILRIRKILKGCYGLPKDCKMSPNQNRQVFLVTPLKHF